MLWIRRPRWKQGVSGRRGEPFCGHCCPCHAGSPGRGLGPFPPPPAQLLTSGPEPWSRQGRAGLRSGDLSLFSTGPPSSTSADSREQRRGRGYSVERGSGLAPSVLGPSGPQSHGPPSEPALTQPWGWFAGKMVSWKRASWKMMGPRRRRTPLGALRGAGRRRGRSTTATRTRRSLTGG